MNTIQQCAYYYMGRFLSYRKIKTTEILQRSDTECGVAALCILFDYHGIKVFYDEISARCAAFRDGCKAETLVNIAAQYGLSLQGFKIEIQDLNTIQSPVIAFWGFSHYVVIEGIGRDKAFINDPACGRITVPLDYLDRMFTGIILYAPLANNLQSKPKPRLFRGKPFIQRDELLLHLIGLNLLVIALSACPPISTTLILVCYLVNHYKTIDLFVSLTMCVVISFVLQFFVQRCISTMLLNISYRRNFELLKHVLALPYQTYLSRATDYFASTIIQYSSYFAAQEYLPERISATLLFISIGLLSIGFIHVGIAALFTVILLLQGLTIYWMTTQQTAIIKRCVYINGRYQSNTRRWLESLWQIKSEYSENNVYRKWSQAYLKKTIVMSESQKTQFTIQIATLFLKQFSIILILCVSFYTLTVQNIGQIIYVYTVFMYLQGIADGLLRLKQQFSAAVPIENSILELNNHKQKDIYANLNISEKYFIKLNNITYSYSKYQKPIIYSLEGEIKKGKQIAIVGASGSGKSTLAKLIARILYPDQGEILYGKELYDLSEPKLNSILYIPQTPSMFANNIWDCLTCFKQYARADVEAVIELVGLGSLMKERDFYLPIDISQKFSGGELQRIALARAILARPSLLILDEATSALDYEAEAFTLQNLSRLNCTVIFISHRLSAIQNCDDIWVMHNSQKVSSGTHSRLLANCSHYSALYNQS